MAAVARQPKPIELVKDLIVMDQSLTHKAEQARSTRHYVPSGLSIL